jgi:hypothetical protein
LKTNLVTVMKKNLYISVILFLGLLWAISSCVKDTFTEQDAYAEQRKAELLKDSLAKAQAASAANLSMQQILLLDSLKKVGGVINYSVDVVVASKSSWWSNYFAYWDKGAQDEQGVMGLDGAVVTLSQYGKLYSVTTNASGIASFSDLRIGAANVNINKTGYTEVDYVVDLPPLTSSSHTMTDTYESGTTVSDSVTQNIVDVVRNGATMVPVFSLTTNLSTVSGKATVETDLTNDAPEAAPGVKIMGIIDVANSDFWQLYMYQPELLDYWYGPTGMVSKFDYYGKIKQIAFGSTISTATTAADGSFTMQVPSTPQGLPIDFEVDQFALNQSLLMPAIYGVPVWGVQSVRTMFGSDISYSPIPNLGTGGIMNVQSAYVQFSAPTGSPAAQPTTAATATAVLASSGIVSINITSPGEGYTQAPLVRISKGTVINSVQAEGTAVLTGGKVTAVTITSAGSGYKPGDTPTVTFSPNIDQTATATPKMGYSIDAIALSNSGAGYTAAPAITINSGTGTGATATANMTGYVSALTLTGGGTGYTATPIVNISTGTGVQATGTANMTAANPVNSIYVPVNSGLWVTRKRGTRITGVGSGALSDSTILSSSGRVSFIAITNAGAGYITAPTVTISGGGGFGAVAHATIAAGAVNTLVLDNAGTGYTSDPVITLTAAPTGGTNATAALRREFQVTGINVTASGNGYASPGTAVQYENAPGSGVFLNAVGFGIVPVLSMSVTSLNLTLAGDGYSAAPTVTITPSNGVVGTAATATASILYSVKNLTVTAQGSGYEFGDASVTIGAPPAGGTQAVAGAITRTNGVLKRIIMGASGMGYTAAPNAIVTLGGGTVPVKQAKLTATVGGGQVTGITITDPGQGYDYASDALYGIAITTYNSGAAASANPNPSSGQIAFINISNPGAGYSVAPEIEIFNDTQGDANGFGTGAVATPVVVDGRISAITLTNAGTGYYVAPSVRIVVVSSVMKALGRCVVSADGRVTGVDFTNPGGGWPGYQFTPGWGYEAAPTVTFFPSVPGKGAGAVGVATINNGRVSTVIMTNEGSGYTGRNKPLQMGFSMTPSSNIYATASRSYVMDFYFGTGKHTVTEQGIF